MNTNTTTTPTPAAREPPVIGTIHAIPISEIHPMPNNPFQIREDPDLLELIESVNQFGVLVPTEVQPREGGGYEMITGARRQYAGSLAGLNVIPSSL